jgi:pseudaminic acid biosynthesis-associated methylase
MNKYMTEQENFWAGKFGEEYIERNNSQEILSTKVAFFSKVLSFTNGISSCIEFGANIGLNLKAIKALLPQCELSAIEINSKAVEELNKIENLKSYNQSILDFNVDYKRDLSIVSGVLIHMNPEVLTNVYDILYNSSQKYILISEYYNPTPVEVNYRGNKGKLFKRDFAGEMMDRYKDLKLIEYGFVYHRDNVFPQDDVNWFLLSK